MKKRNLVLVLAVFLIIFMSTCAPPVSPVITPLPGPQNLMVPPMGFDDTSITVIWSKPTDYSNVDSYNVYRNGTLVTNTKNLFYNATGLFAGSTYTFYVTSKMKDLTESSSSNTISQATPVMAILTITNPPYNADSTGATLCTTAIQNAINDCASGGKVVIPAGTFLSGAIFLKSNMTLQIDGTLRGSDSAADYPHTSWRFPYYASQENYTGLINAYPMTSFNPPTEVNMSLSNPYLDSYYGTVKNVRICGSGIVNGSSDVIGSILSHGTTKLGTAEYAASEDSDRGDMICAKGVYGLYIGGLKLYNPAMHTMFVSYCKNVTINGITASTYDIHNADGIDLCTTDTAYIFNSVWDTGDDCINFNAGQGWEGVIDGHPDLNIRVFDCTANRGHGGVVCGSFTAAWIHDVLVEDCVFDGTEIGFRFKTGNNNGGGVYNYTGRDVVVKNIVKNSGIFVDSTYNASGYTSATPGQFKNMTFKNISCQTLNEYGIYVNGLSAMSHTNLTFTNITIDGGKKGGVYLNYCTNSTFDTVTITNSTPTWSINSGTTSGITRTNSTP